MVLGNLVVALIFFGIASVICRVQAEEESIPRPEHPRPDAQRMEWLNLNGTWEFAETDDDTDEKYLGNVAYPDKIVVPFCRESKLSGLERKGFVKNVWYRRTFKVPADWKSPRIRLHVGACDWATRVWVNGQLIGRHFGGNAEIVFEVTDALKRDGENTIIVHAFDDARSGLQALGKQSNREKSWGIFYTRTTGIWQTVWLEGVGSTFISDFSVIPLDPGSNPLSESYSQRAFIQASLDGPSNGLILEAGAYISNKIAGGDRVPANWRNNHFELNLEGRYPWSLDRPILYDLELTLWRENEIVDTVQGYFGLRKVSLEGSSVLINGKPVFQRLVLDQGFYPDGVWTAPSDEALKHDIEMSKALGFNGARLHQKVFEPRFHYWADKLGYLTWGEFPSYGPNYANPAVNTPIQHEWTEILQRDRNHPSIIGWCPFNETPATAGALQNSIAAMTRAIDPTRPVIDTSGYIHSLPDPEIMDAHDYDQNPKTLGERFQRRLGAVDLPPQYGGPKKPLPFMISEYGGIGWVEEENKNVWGYGKIPKSKEEWYARFAGLTNALLDNRNLFGFCYTQLTDVEQERNGLFFFDRQPKFNAEKIRAIVAREAAYEKDPPLKPSIQRRKWTVLVGAFPDASAKEWNYTTDAPPADWNQSGFDALSWKRGMGGFGHKEGWKTQSRTEWTTKDIWLRQEFEYDGSSFDAATLVAHYDNGAEAYVNGREIWRGEGWSDDYAPFDATEKLRGAIQKGKNLIAIHCHQDEGGQFLDAALLVGR